MQNDGGEDIKGKKENICPQKKGLNCESILVQISKYYNAMNTEHIPQ
jgi:hypothetical protein